jgi:hypothetical protein
VSQWKDAVQQKALIKTAVVVTSGAIIATLLLLHFLKRKPVVLSGAIIRQDVDTKKELPISDVEVSVAGGNAATRSDASGFFRLRLEKGVKAGGIVTLQFRHSGYLPLDLNIIAGDNLYVARMIPITRDTHDDDSHAVVVSNVRVRYSVSATTVVNIGSAVRTFQVVNAGNVPCNGQPPCSPDGRWKAAIGSVSLDAGLGNEFRNARASCIAGPCPFTKIDSSGFSDVSRTITASAIDWSDTVTVLVEAEVFHEMVSDNVRESYPVIFGQALNFTLPATAEGVSIEAELNGDAIVFPLGPDLFLSWAECDARVNKDQTKVYRCELKPGHRF